MLGFPIYLLLRIEAIGFPTFGLLLYEPGNSNQLFGASSLGDQGLGFRDQGRGQRFHGLRLDLRMYPGSRKKSESVVSYSLESKIIPRSSYQDRVDYTIPKALDPNTVQR